MASLEGERGPARRAGRRQAILARIGGATEPGMKILRDHPDTKARVAAVEPLSPVGTNRAMLTGEVWSALRRICKDQRTSHRAPSLFR
jgi:hypothetical protein